MPHRRQNKDRTNNKQNLYAEDSGLQRSNSTENPRGEAPITCINMNLSGQQNTLGNTPQYKVTYIASFLESEPDVIFLQDCIDKSSFIDMVSKMKSGNYQTHFQYEEEEKKGKDGNSSPAPPAPLTAIVWDTDKYTGTPLDLTDSRLGDYANWIKKHSITVVRLVSTHKGGISEEGHPTFIGVSWHGVDYDTPLGIRTKQCEEFIDFVTTLRKKNSNMPIIVGGDFNLDIKTFQPLEAKPALLTVANWPGSGVTKDFKNTFLYTMDAVQILETQYRQFHPEIFSCPWVVIRVRGRNQLKLWALVKIQRSMKRYLKRQARRMENAKKMRETRILWKKKLQGSDYHPSPPPTPPEVRKQREKQQTRQAEEIARRKRDEFYSDYTKEKVEEEGKPEQPANVDYGFRRKKYDDLKSVQERKQESKAMEEWFSY